MVASITPPSAGTAVAVPLTTFSSTQSIVTHSNTNNRTTNTNPVQSSSGPTFAVKVRQWLWSRSRKAVSLVVSPVKKVFTSFEKTTGLFGLLLTLLFGPLGFVAIKIAIWQSLKDWYFYCLEQKNTVEMEASTRLKCDKTLQNGLPPPPFSVFKRDLSQATTHAILHARSLMDEQTRSSDIQSHVAALGASLHAPPEWRVLIIAGAVYLLAFIVFVLSNIAIPLARQGWRRLRTRTPTTPQTTVRRNVRKFVLGVAQLLSIFSVISTATLMIVIWHEQAESDYLTYCQMRPEQGLPAACLELKEKIGSTESRTKSGFAHTFPAFMIGAALLITVAAVIWIVTVADLRLITELRRVVRTHISWSQDIEDPAELCPIHEEELEQLCDSGKDAKPSVAPKDHKIKIKLIPSPRDSPPTTVEPKLLRVKFKRLDSGIEALKVDMGEESASSAPDEVVMFENERESRRDLRNLVRKMAQDIPQTMDSTEEQALVSGYNSEDEGEFPEWWMGAKGVHHRQSY